MSKIIYDQPAAEYFAAEGLNNTSIGYLLECPALYKAHQTMEETPSKAFLLGSLGGSLTDVCWLCFGVCAVFSQLPYPLFASIIGVTNGLFPLVLGAAVLSLVGMRIKKWGLAFTSIMKAEDFNTNMKFNILGVVFLIVAPLIAIVVSLIMSANGTQVGTPLVWVSLPALVISLVGSCLIGLSPDIFEKPEEE